MRTSPEPIRILQVIGAMDRGGAETLVMNLYRCMDRDHIQFDFLVNEKRACDYDEEILGLGGKIFRIPRFNIANTLPYARACEKFFSAHRYPVVHGHIALPSAIYLSVSKKGGAVAIAHSHAQNYPLSPAELAFRVCTRPTRRIADYFLACSEQAGLDRFGQRVVEGPRFHVLKNGIDTERGRFSAQARSRIRAEIGVDATTPVVGHVGRLTSVKNHPFLLDVFAQVRETLPEARLVLVGRGEDEDALRGRVRDLGLEGAVSFLGVREDVPDILSALDVFVFPSFKEGLANATIEAQASGLPCLLSTGVPDLARIREKTERLDLRLGATAWAEHVVDALRASDPQKREDAYLDARAAGFDISESAAWLAAFYERLAAEGT